MGGNDVLTGGAGLDSVFGGADNDRAVIVAASDLVAGETYDGGAGSDTLSGTAVVAAASLVGLTVQNFETVNGFSGGLTLTAAQLDQFTGDVNTGTLTIADAGTIDISDARVFTDTINLAAAGNTLTLNSSYGAGGGFFNGTVNGGAAADTVTVINGGGFYAVTLNGAGGGRFADRG